MGQRERIEAFCNNMGASTGEEGDRSARWERVVVAVHSAVLVEKDCTWSHPRGLGIAYSD